MVNIFPEININLDKITQVKESEIKPLGKSLDFDFSNCDHKIIDGKPVILSNIENIKQWIYKVLTTDINKYRIYTEDEQDNFGISIFKYIGCKDLPIGYINAELQREIEEQLIKHRYIKNLENFKVERKSRGLNISFKVILKNSEEFNYEQEVI